MIKADDFGWFIDLPCSICRKDNCPGAVHVWLPNKIGNVEIVEGDVNPGKCEYKCFTVCFDNKGFVEKKKKCRFKSR